MGALVTLRAAYGLLAELLEWGPVPRLRPFAEASPALCRALADAEQDELEVAHTQAFAFHVFPFAGVFLHESGQAGAGASKLLEAYRQVAFDPCDAAPGLDHLSTLLRALAQAHRDTESVRHLIDHHVLSWLPVWVDAVRRLDLAWPAALATQIEELVTHHREALGPGATEGPLGLPVLPDLEARDTDFQRIASALTTPAIAGAFLSRHDLTTIARGLEIPTGFGSRVDLLANTMGGAVQYEKFPELLHRIRAVFLETRQAISASSSSRPESWTARMDASMAMLSRLGDAAPSAAA